MAYFINLFSPQTYEAFKKSDQTVSGFRPTQSNFASKVQVGDKLVCYMTKLSRWIGILEVVSPPFESDDPVFMPEHDPFTLRFRVKTLAWLEPEKAIPIHDDAIWRHLSFTRGLEKKSLGWTGKVRASLTPISNLDGELLESSIRRQADNDGRVFEINEREYGKLITHTVRREDKDVTVTVPVDLDPDEIVPVKGDEVRESIKVQALLADIGAKMGMKVWIPRNDRGGVLSELSQNTPPILDRLPLNYDDTTLKTIEQIDVLWLRGRSIVRAFEVEHTTSIYSGILRMADLLALQPNMDIKLHIVAPFERRDKVFQELKRPVFSLLDRGPLYESCTYLSYDRLRELSELKHLSHLSDSVLDEYAEEAE